MRHSETLPGIRIKRITHIKVIALSVLMACSPVGVLAQTSVSIPPTATEPEAAPPPPPVNASPADASLSPGNRIEPAAAATEAPERHSLEHLIQRAENGEPHAQFQLAHRYLKGDGVTADNIIALQWFTRAAEQGNPNAQYNIAVMYLNGIGVIQDNAAAVEWFQKAANNGDAQAQFTLAIILFNGQYGVPQNTPQAYKWFTLAGSAGIREAAANAVLIQEMMPPGQVGQMQEEALNWIESYQARQTPITP
jgi:TPR repeat protein